MKKQVYYILALLFLWMTACKKDPKVAELPYDLVVEGGINTYTTRQYIKLTRPASFNQVAASAVSGAKVSVNDGVEDMPFSEISNSGIYTAILVRNRNFYEPYALKIEYNSNVYSAADTLVPVIPIDESYLPLKASLSDTRVKLEVPKHTFGTSSAQQWLFLTDGSSWSARDFDGNFNYTYSHVFGTPNALNPLTREKTIIDLGLDEKIDVYKYSLSEAYSRYLYNFFQETAWKGLLSSTPANLKGNISGKAAGFFYTTDVERQSYTGKSLLER